MDPNTGKKGMFNKLSKEQAMHLLSKEDFQRRTVSFYRYVIIDNPNLLRDQLYEEWIRLGVLGRIYLAQEGINAQLSVPEFNWEDFKNCVYKNKFFNDVIFKKAVEDDGKSFFKLTIKVRKQIVCLLYTSPSPRDGLLSRMPSSA